MPRYRVLVKSYIKGEIREPEEIVAYDGKPGSNLELVGPQVGRRKKTAATPAAPPADDPRAPPPVEEDE